MSKVFVSYSSRDRNRSADIVHALEKKNIECWVAPRDIEPGALWMESVIEAIDECRAVLLLVTANSNSSNQVRRELERAVSKSKPIVPLILEEVQFSKWMQYSISIHHWYSTEKGDLFRRLDDVVTVLCREEDEQELELSSASPQKNDFILELFNKKRIVCLSVKYFICSKGAADNSLLEINNEIVRLAESVASLNGLGQKYTESKTEFAFSIDTDINEPTTRARVLLAAYSITNGLKRICERYSQAGVQIDFQVMTFPEEVRSKDDKSGLTIDRATLDWLQEESIDISEGFEESVALLRQHIGGSVSKLPECELVGRRKQLEVIHELVEKQQFWHVNNPRGYATHLIAGIKGEPGTGKTAIIRHIEKELFRDSDLLLLKGDAPEKNGITGGLWIRVIENLMGMKQVQGITDDVIASFVRESYGVSISPYDARSISMFLSSNKLGEDSEQENNQVEVEIAFRNLFEALAEKYDPVFLLENVHNSDEISMKILRFLVANTERRRPYVFVVTFRPLQCGRPVFLEMPSGYYEYELIQLDGLEYSELEQMCNLLMACIQPGVCCSDDLLEYVFRKTGGNPLFIRELLETMIQQEALQIESGQWVLNDEVSPTVSSENVRILYDERLKSLDEEQRVLLKCLSVLGHQFSFSTMYEYLDSLSYRITTRKSDLIGSLEGFLKDETTVFRRTVAFSHSLLREYLYSKLNDDQLAALHLAAGQTFEKNAGSDPGLIAIHYRIAGKTENAINWAMKKLEVLTGMHDHGGILDWSAKVLEWMTDTDEHIHQEFELRAKRYSSLTTLGRKADADSELKALERLVDERNLKELEKEVRLLRASFLIKTGGITEAKKQLDSIKNSVDSNSSKKVLLDFYDVASRFHQLDYDSDKALEYIKKALAMSPPLKYDIKLKKRMATIMGGRQGQEEAREILFAALDSARNIHAPVLELDVLNSIARSYFDTGDWQEAEEYWDRGIKLASNTGNRSREAVMLNLLGHMYSRTRTVDDALRMQKRALEVMEEAGNKHEIGKVLNDLGLLYTRTGEKDKALKTFERSLQIARELSNKGAIGSALSSLSSLKKDLGEYELAEKFINEAISIWRETGYMKREAACIANRGTILEKMGRLDEAIECFKAAVLIGERCVDREGNSKRYGNLAVMMQIKHNWEEAEKYYDKAIQMCSDMGNIRMKAIWTGFKGALLDTTGKREKALKNYRNSMEVLKEIGEKQYLFIMMGNYAGLLSKMGNEEDAFRIYKEKLTLCREKGYKVDEASALCDIGNHYRMQGDFETSFKYFRDACLIASEKKIAVHMFRGIMALYRVLKERSFPVHDFFPEHWGNPEKILRDSHKPEQNGKES